MGLLVACDHPTINACDFTPVMLHRRLNAHGLRPRDIAQHINRIFSRTSNVQQ